jgi:hypothetical protein
MVPDVSGYYDFVSNGANSYWKRRLGGYYLWSVWTGTTQVRDWSNWYVVRYITVNVYASFISPAPYNYGGPIWQYDGTSSSGQPTSLGAGIGAFNPRTGCSGTFWIISKYISFV